MLYSIKNYSVYINIPILFIVIVAHDTFMTAVSNIKSLPEYASRQRKRTINGVVRDDWWIVDFTVDELKRVGIN